MVKYILKRVAILLVTLWVVVTLSFFLMQVMSTPTSINSESVSV